MSTVLPTSGGCGPKVARGMMVFSARDASSLEALGCRAYVTAVSRR
jgi:hypothetical protein